jgi:succinoglycan biosynthesis protein ExoA
MHTNVGHHLDAAPALNPARQTASVVVIMPVRNEAAHITATLQQVLDLRRDGIALEILVVDGESTDDTAEIVASIADRYPEVSLKRNPFRLSSAARNIGVNSSRGEFIVIIDGHCQIPSDSYLLDLVDAFRATGAECLGRPQPLEVTGATPLQRAIASARASRLGHHPDSFIYTAERRQVPAQSVAVAYRRTVFDRIGMFDEAFDACEDGELNYRIDAAGMLCILDPRLTVKYQPRNSWSGLFRQLSRYGRGRVRLARKHPKTFSWGSFLPALFWIGVMIGPVICTFAPRLWPLYGGIIAVYLAAIIMETTRLAWSLGDRGLLLRLPAVFVMIHLGAAAGVIGELASPSSSRMSHTKPVDSGGLLQHEDSV